MLLWIAPLALFVAAPTPGSAAPASKVREIFEDKCTSCHDASDDLDLTVPLERLTALTGASGKAMVAAGDPAGSYLLDKLIDHEIAGDLMPLGDDPLPPGEIEAVRQWIAGLAVSGEGAKEPAAKDPAVGRSPGAVTSEAPVPGEAEVRALFAERCIVCHDEGADEVVLSGSLGHLIATTDPATGKRLLIPGDVEGSYLWIKVTGGSEMVGELMPMGDEQLSDPELAVIRDYIRGLGEVTGASRGEERASGDGAVTEPPRRDKPPFHGTFQHNLPTTAGLGHRRFEFRIDHRFGRVGTERGAFGLDAGVVMSVGFAYGIRDGWDVMIRRSNSRKGYELGTKYIPIRQEAGFPVSFGGYTSIEYLRDFPSNTANPLSGNFQAMVSRLWFDRWSTMLLVGYSLRTNRSANLKVDFEDGQGPVPARDTRNTLGLGLASTVWLGKKRRWGVDLEYHLPIPSNAFFHHGGDADPNGTKIGSWALGGSYSSGLHFFQIFFTNTREIHTSLYAPGGQTANPFENRGNFFLGFNLSRKWTIKQRKKNRKTADKKADKTAAKSAVEEG